VKHGRDLLLDDPLVFSKILVYTLSLCFCFLVSTMYELPWCSASQIVPLRVESNWKGVKAQILDYGFEILIDPRNEASMSNVVS